jgi:hypothetical protein
MVESREIETSGGQAAAKKNCSWKMLMALINPNPQRLARRWFGIAPRPRDSKLD